MPLIRLPTSRLGEVRLAIELRWRKLRGRTGEFEVPENSDRSRQLSQTWEARWAQSVPIGYRLRESYPNRWMRFHSLPGSQRYAESEAEYDEILHRQRVVLAELQSGFAPSRLIVVAEDWGWRDLAAGWSRRYVHNAWPWRKVSDPDDEGTRYMWADSGLSGPAIEKLLRAIADDRGRALLADPGLTWLFCPYDGGVDVFLPDAEARDALRERHAAWLSDTPSGL